MKRIGICLVLLTCLLILASFAMAYARIFGAGPEWADAALLTFIGGFLTGLAATFPGWWGAW